MEAARGCRGFAFALGVQVHVEVYSAEDSVRLLTDERNVLCGIRVLLNFRKLFGEKAKTDLR